MVELLLASNSLNYNSEFLSHLHEPLEEMLPHGKSIAFVGFALDDQEQYVAAVREKLQDNYQVNSVPISAEGAGVVQDSDAVFIGGGNTFRLKQRLEQTKLLDVIRNEVLAGKPYFGSSAGTNVAGPTIRTSNDMPIVEPESFSTFAFVPFQINPHYVDPPKNSTHMGEPRAMRIKEFLEANDVAVLGLFEGSWLRRSGDRLSLQGGTGARLFKKDKEPEDFSAGSDLSALLSYEGRFDLEGTI